MLFNSIEFLIFFPIVAIIYFLIPYKVRYIWLLAASYYFYMCWNVKYVLLLLASTVITYTASMLIAYCDVNTIWSEKEKIARKKLCVAASLLLNLGILIFFKYFAFIVDIINQIRLSLYVPAVNAPFDVLLPVGISFYIFQALGYTIDVYRGNVKAEKNFLRYALFVSFFPQLVAGPIERSGNLLKQLEEKHTFSFERMVDGLLLMLWGYFMKLVIADRIAIFVDVVYGDLDTYAGWYVIIATVLFAFQIFCDFAGYSTIAMGAAQILGIQLMENFNAPYLSRSVTEFWRRWHISLSSWFKDYLYIPLGGSRKGVIRKYRNVLIVFLTSGLWHGANWTYVVWGGVNGLYQILEKLLEPFVKKTEKIMKIRKDTISYTIGKILITFVAVDFSWIFFRAATMQEAGKAIKGIWQVHNLWVLSDGSLYQILSEKNFHIIFIGLALLIFADICKYRGIKIRVLLQEQALWFRFGIYIAGVVAVLVFGIYGYGYDAGNFIYFQF